MVFPILKMKKLNVSATSHRIKRNKSLFCFEIGICSQSLCRAFHGASFKRKIKILSFCQAKQKVFQTFLLCSMQWEKALSCCFFILSMGRTIRTSQKEFVYTIFVELLTAHLLKNKPRFYHFVKSIYMRN